MADVVMVTDEYDQGNFDPFEVKNKRDGYRYRLLNNNERNLLAKKRKGYEIVKDSDPEKLGCTDSAPMKKGADLDTTQRFNDVVLARIPVEKIEAMKARNQQLIKHRAGEPDRQFKKDTGEFGFDARKGSGGSTIYQGGITQAEAARLIPGVKAR